MVRDEILKKIGLKEALSSREKQEFLDWATTMDDTTGSVSALLGVGVPSALDNPLFPFYSKTLTIAEASINIPISGGYKHLLMIGSGKSTDETTDVASLRMSFNGVSGKCNYGYIVVSYLSDFFVGVQDVSGTLDYAIMGLWPTATNTASYNGSFVSTVYNYGGNKYKQVATSTSMFGEPVIGLKSAYSGELQGTWLSTSPVTSVNLTLSHGSFAAGSSISVYGMK